MPSCPAGWLFSSPHRPVLRTGGERGGASSQHCSCTLAREEEAGEEGYRGLEPNWVSGLEPSNSFQLLPHPPDFLPWEWCLVGFFPPLFSSNVWSSQILGSPQVYQSSLSYHCIVLHSWTCSNPRSALVFIHPGSPFQVCRWPPAESICPVQSMFHMVLRQSKSRGTQAGVLARLWGQVMC